MQNWIIGIIIAIVVALALVYIIKQKKKGAKCIGCPSSGSCGKKNCCCDK